MEFLVDDSIDDLRFKVGAAIEYDRPLDLTIEGGGAQVEIHTTERIKSSAEGAGKLIVSFVVPNPYRLQRLEIPDEVDGYAIATTYPRDEISRAEMPVRRKRFLRRR